MRREAREDAISKDNMRRPVEVDGIGYELSELLARLKLCPKPTTFWLSMFQETPGTQKDAIEAHRFFCRTACDVSSIVGQDCGAGQR